MRTKFSKKLAKLLFISIASYLATGSLFHWFLFSEQKPVVVAWPKHIHINTIKTSRIEKAVIIMREADGMDEETCFESSPNANLQIRLFQNSGFNAYLLAGAPTFIHKIKKYIIASFSRVIEYKCYNKNYNSPVMEKQ